MIGHVILFVFLVRQGAYARKALTSIVLPDTAHNGRWQWLLRIYEWEMTVSPEKMAVPIN